ncbi:hypothetical protein COV19_07505 [Candidatus Woesearchaeota archaeon CG10_big_fil_rev_8_21_14_0_10_44_13]|nr:MAG: hypothetical protein COV19_07505 [Candidatus Woesearchaeota archaeon CG10_big_fil_rev_8_21_14_0_10_44_13]
MSNGQKKFITRGEFIFLSFSSAVGFFTGVGIAVLKDRREDQEESIAESLESAVSDAASTPETSAGTIPRDERITDDYIIVVGLQQLTMYVFKGGANIRQFPVSVGASRTPTPPGEYFIKGKVRNPSWHFPKRRLDLLEDYPKGHVPSRDPRNPIRHYWIELRRVEKPDKNIPIGIHGTNMSKSIPGRNSQGCIRMNKEGIYYVAKNIPLYTRLDIIEDVSIDKYLKD